MQRVRAALAHTDGVWQVGFDLDTDSIFVAYDARLGDPAAASRPLCAAIVASGYEPCWMRAPSWPAGVEARGVR